MKFLLLFAVLLAGFLVFVRYMGPQAPLRGLAQILEARQPVLVSRARPAVVFVPSPDMEAQTAGWRDLAPKTRISQPGSARLWFVTYGNGTGLLVTALAEATDPWMWRHGHHEPFEVLQSVQYEHDGHTLYESVVLLRPGQNPFDSASTPCLAYRAKFVLQFQKMLAVVEYQEPVSSEMAHDAAFEPDLLKAFRERGRKACRVTFPNRQQDLKEHMTSLDPADAGFSRTALSTWVGEMYRERDL